MKENVNNSKDTPDIARTTWVSHGGKVSALSPILRKVLTGISVGQVMLVAVAAATLGVFVNSNMKEIGMLKETTEKMQAKIDILESSQGSIASPQRNNETRWLEMESKIKDVQTKHETDFLSLSNDITELEIETEIHNSTIQDHETRLTHMEANMANNGSNYTVMQDHETRISQLEADNDNRSVSGNITGLETIKNTMVQLQQNISANDDKLEIVKTKIEEIEVDRTLDQKSIQNLNKSITDLKFDLAEEKFALQVMNVSINNIETARRMDRVLIETINDTFTQMQDDFSTQTVTVKDMNLTLRQMAVDVEMNKELVLNITDRLSNMSGKDATSDLYNNLDARVTKIEDGLACSWSNWTALSNCSSAGTRYRERVCESQDPGFTGPWCSRKDIDIQTCNWKPVDGGWGEWGSYSTCSVTCQGGTQTRERVCDSPRPSIDGQTCPGEAEETRTCNDHLCIPIDCSELDMPNPSNGRYQIYPNRNPDEAIAVRCQFDGDGAWTVIQRRLIGFDFYKGWDEYKTGFGDVDTDYWLGNEYIHIITSAGDYKLKVELTDWEGEFRHALYTTFRLAGESDNYRITVYGYSGDAGDSLSEYHNGMEFSTMDRDNDGHLIRNCAGDYYGAWWYNSCGSSCLNGQYYPGSTVPNFDSGIKWSGWHSSYSYRFATMMIQKS